MNLNALDKERISAALKWAADNPAHTENALEIINTNSGYPRDPNSAIQDKEENLKPLEGGQSKKG